MVERIRTYGLIRTKFWKNHSRNTIGDDIFYWDMLISPDKVKKCSTTTDIWCQIAKMNPITDSVLSKGTIKILHWIREALTPEITPSYGAIMISRRKVR